MALDSQTRAERWALALLALSGAAFLPDALNRFVFPKLAVVAVALILAARAPSRGRLPRVAVALLGLAALLLVGSSIAAATPRLALLGAAPRYEGILVLPLYLGAVLAGARLLGPGRPAGSAAWFLDWLALAALAIGALAILEVAGLRPLTSSVARPGSLLGNASDEGAWAVLALGPLGTSVLRAREPLHVAGFLAAAAALVCSGSRGALVGAVAVAVVLAALSPRGVSRLAVLAGVAVLAAATFALPATRGRVLETAPLASETVTGRELLWHETLRLIAAHPLVGVGPSGYLDAIPRYHDRRYALQIGPANPPDSPHDWLLQAAVAGGLPLALLAVALALLTLRRGALAARRERRDGELGMLGGMLAGLAGYAATLLFDFTSPGTTPLAAVYAGALLAEPAAIAAGLRVSWTWQRRAITAGLALLIVVLATAAFAELPLRLAIVAARGRRVAAANQDFRTAQLLRPWDGAIAAAALNSFAVLASGHAPGAAREGATWVSRALDGDPRSSTTLADAAAIDLARGRPASAASLLARALRLDPDNSDLHVEAAAAATALHQASAAAQQLRAAARLS